MTPFVKDFIILSRFMLPLNSEIQFQFNSGVNRVSAAGHGMADGGASKIVAVPNDGPQVGIVGGGMLAPVNENVKNIENISGAHSLVSEYLKTADETAQIYYKDRWGAGDVGAGAVLKSGVKRSLEDLEGFFGFFRRVIFLPLGIYEAFKLNKMSKEEAGNQTAVVDALLKLQEAFYNYCEAKNNAQNVDQDVDLDVFLAKAKENFKTVLKESATLRGEAFDEEKFEKELDRLYAKEALRRDEKLALMGDMGYTLKWYAVNTLKTISSVLGKIAEIGFPVLSGLAKVFELMVRSLEAFVEGKGFGGEFAEWVDSFDFKSIGVNLSKDQKNIIFSNISENIKNKQDLALKFIAIFKEGLAVSSFGLFCGAAVLGVLALSGVIAATAAIFVLKASVIIGALTLPVASGYLIYRLSRWVKRNTMIGKAEMTLLHTQNIADNDPEKSQKITKREKALNYLLKHDGRFASFYLARGLFNENQQTRDSIENEEAAALLKQEKPMRAFLKQFKAFTTEDWTILNRFDEDQMQAAAQLMSRRLNLI